MAEPIYFSKTLAAASVNNIALTQTPLAAGDLTLNGSAVSGGVATLDTPRRVLLTFAANETGHNFTVYGLNSKNGNPIYEVVAGTTVSAYTNHDFYTVTRVAISAAATGAIQVGTNGVGSSQWRSSNIFLSPSNWTIGVVVTGTVNYTIQWTLSTFDAPVPYGTATPVAVAYNDSILNAATANGVTTLNDPITGWRVLINSGTGSVSIQAVQAGIAGP